jgi:hypothetical protein
MADIEASAIATRAVEVVILNLAWPETFFRPILAFETIFEHSTRYALEVQKSRMRDPSQMPFI